MSDDIYKMAVDKWGVISQAGMVMEECAELIKEVHKFFFRSGNDVAALADEVADVEIMCSQLRVIIGCCPVDEAKKYKLDRLRKQVDPC